MKPSPLHPFTPSPAHPFTASCTLLALALRATDANLVHSVRGPTSPEPILSVEAPEATFACPRCGAEYVGGDACPSCGFLQSPVPCDDDPSRNAAYRCVLC